MVEPLKIGDMLIGWWKSSHDKPSADVAGVTYPYLIWTPESRLAVTRSEVVQLINHLHEMLAEERESNRRE